MEGFRMMGPIKVFLLHFLYQLGGSFFYDHKLQDVSEKTLFPNITKTVCRVPSSKFHRGNQLHNVYIIFQKVLFRSLLDKKKYCNIC